jgi:hypothetical protein
MTLRLAHMTHSVRAALMTAAPNDHEKVLLRRSGCFGGTGVLDILNRRRSRLSSVLNHARLTDGLTYRRDNLTHQQNGLRKTTPKVVPESISAVSIISAQALMPPTIVL